MEFILIVLLAQEATFVEANSEMLYLHGLQR